jgi:hypothetical protein
MADQNLLNLAAVLSLYPRNAEAEVVAAKLTKLSASNAVRVPVLMSAIGGKADIALTGCDVCF